ncbi:MAG: hypothetical protein WBL95_01900 [Microcoleus sp.]
MYIAQLDLSITNITSIVQTIAVVGSLIYLAIQVKESTKATKGATYQSIISAWAELESRISQDDEVARIYKLGLTTLEKLNENEFTRFNELICSFFNMYENLYYQYKNKLLEEELWAGWCLNMREDLKHKGAAAWWNSKSHLYSKSFREYVNSGKCPRN